MTTRWIRLRQALAVADNGFTLVDMLAGLMLVSISFLGTTMLAGAVTHGTIQSRDTTTATFAAQEKLEALRAQGYESIPLGSSVSPDVHKMFSRTTVVGGGQVPNTKKVDVRIDWTGLRPHSVTLTGMLYDRNFAEAVAEDPADPGQPSPASPSPAGGS